MKVPLFDLTAYHTWIRQRVLDSFQRVYDSGSFISGDEVAQFESELGTFVGARFAVGVSSGTDALIASLLALDVGPEHEVLTTPFSFMATASAIRSVGATVRFADIEEDGYGIDPRQVEPAIRPNTAAVVAVHLYGSPCNITALRETCSRRNISLVEDAAQALGARHQGRHLGTIGDVGCYSFFPAKSLGALGDAGAIVTSSEVVNSRLRRIRVHGAERRHHHVEHGSNLRLDELQAAFLRLKLADLEQRLRQVRGHARYYQEALGGLDALVLPPSVDGVDSSYSLYTVRVPARRDALRAALERNGVATQVHYPTPLHLQPALKGLGHRLGDFPNAERRCQEVLSIPIYPDLSEAQREYVVAQIRAFFDSLRTR